MQPDAERLVGYCGRFCGTCGISDFQIGTGVAAVRGIVKAAGFKREAEHLGWPLMRDLATHCCAQFEGQIASFAELSTKLFPTNCRGGCVPPCEIAACCKGRGYTTCAECADLESCAKIAGVTQKNPALRDNLKAITKDGFRSWAQAQVRAARAARKRELTEAVAKAIDRV